MHDMFSITPSQIIVLIIIIIIIIICDRSIFESFVTSVKPSCVSFIHQIGQIKYTNPWIKLSTNSIKNIWIENSWTDLSIDITFKYYIWIFIRGQEQYIEKCS